MSYTESSIFQLIFNDMATRLKKFQIDISITKADM